MTHMGKYILGFLSASILSSAQILAKNYGAIDIEPKGSADFNGTKMSFVWRYFRQEETIKIDSEKSLADSYTLQGTLENKKIGAAKFSQRIIRTSPSTTRVEADFKILGKPPKGSPLTPSFQFHLPKDIFEGRVFADGKAVAPDVSNFSAKEMAIQSESGELKISGNLKVVRWTSTRQRVLKYYTVSIMADDIGNGEYKIGFDMSYDKNKRPVPLAGEYVVRESEDYRPIDVARKIEPSSALDFSFLLDAPAGKYGFIKTDGAKYVFEKSPKKKVRFFGANICQSALLPEKADAKILAEEFAASGYNSARLHQFSGILRGSPTDSALLHERNMDKFDYLFAELKKRGIYMTTDFYASGKLYPHEYDDVDYRGDNMKALFFASPKARAALKRFISNFLNHVNPYTGLAYKDEPALFLASIVNEDAIAGVQNFVVRTHLDRDIFKPLYAKWLAENSAATEGRSENEKYQLFLISMYNDFYAEMKSHIKNIAPHILLAEQTNTGGSLVISMSENYDVVDGHSYNGHPLFYERRFTVPLYVDSSDALEKKSGAFIMMAARRILTKPSAVTEWDYVRPNPTAAEGGLIVGAYSALNGIDGLWHFTYTHSREKIAKNDRLGMFDTAGDAVRTLANKIGALIHLRRDVSESKVVLPTLVESDFYTNGNTENAYRLSPQLAELALVAKTGNIVAKDAESAMKKLPANTAAVLYSSSVMMPRNSAKKIFDAFDKDLVAKVSSGVKLGDGAIDLANGTYLSSNRQLFLDTKNAAWKAATPRSEIFIQREGRSLKGDFAEVKNTKGWSIVAVCSLEKKPLKSSSRILVAHLTDMMNDGQRFASDKFNVVLEWGSAKYLLKRGDSEISFSDTLENFKCFALDTSGRRIAEIPIVRSDASAAVKISTHNPFGSVIAYELVKNPAK